MGGNVRRWYEIFPAEQVRIATLLIERVNIAMAGLNVRHRTDGLSGLVREMMAGEIGRAA